MRKVVSKLDAKITKHVNDIIQKYASSLFRNVTLDFYGIKTAPIKELINPELPTVEVGGGAADLVFLLENDSYLHLAFQTGLSKKALAKCAGYDLRLFERDGRITHTVVIYTADVRKKPPRFNIGSLAYSPDVILMGSYDGNAIFTNIEFKIKSGQDLTDVEMLNLMLLPLMRHTMPRRELAASSIKLAQSISDSAKRNACIAVAFALASKYLDESDISELKGVVKVTDIGVMLFMDEITEIARKMLKRGMSISAVVEDTGLDENTVKELQAEIETPA